MRRSLTIVVPPMCLAIMACRNSARYAANSAPADSSSASASLPPITPLATRRPADGTHRFSLYMRSPGHATDTLLGTMTVQQTTLTSSARSVVQRVITYDYGTRGTVIDTTLSDAATLAPLSERTYKLRTHGPSSTIIEKFTGREVTGRMGPADSVRVIDDTLPAPAFNSTDLELVVRSLPLRVGLRTSLPIYDPEFGGFRLATVQVDSVETTPRAHRGAAPSQAWVVRARDTRVESVFHVDTLTRALLGSEIRQLPRGAQYRLVPSTGG